MHLYVYNGRHVVVSEVEKPEEGSLKVVRVCLVDDVGGAKRRGRHPSFDQPVPVAKLVAVDAPSDDLVKEAQAALTKSAAPEVTDAA